MADSDFINNKFTVVRGAFDPMSMEIATTYSLINEANATEIVGDSQVPNSYSKYADVLMESILISAHEIVEEVSGLSLYPTYAFYRVYRSGNKLDKHTDRPECEISASMCLGYEYPSGYEGWPIWADGQKVILNPGDMIVYRGAEVEHWRDEFDVPNSGDFFHSQVFMHWVDADGPYQKLRYDGRERLGLPLREK